MGMMWGRVTVVCSIITHRHNISERKYDEICLTFYIVKKQGESLGSEIKYVIKEIKVFSIFAACV